MGERISKSILYTSVLTARDYSGEQVGLGNMAKKFNYIIICLQNLTNAAERSFDEKMKITVFVTDVNQACDNPSSGGVILPAVPIALWLRCRS